MQRASYFSLVLLAGLGATASAAAPDRITRPIDAGRTRLVKGAIHRLADAQTDRGAVPGDMRMDYMVMVFKPSGAQQADLDRLLADQQNPSSPLYRQWLTPEEFGDRFGLSSSDHSKVVAWLTSQGFRINESGRARNWVAFSGSATQVTRAFRTPIHHFQVEGKQHFANAAEPSVPEALEDVVWGFMGFDDFLPTSFAIPASPQFTSGTSHFLVPEDFATIYNITPLYKAGIDGTGQSIAIVGQSSVLLSDLAAFQKRYNLPNNVPKLIPYSGVDPGFNGAQLEGNLDLEWASALAPNATIYYVYGTNAFTAILAAVSLNVAPVISASYGSCEINAAPTFYRAMGQQANAQGITIVNASGDSGAAGCDTQGSEPFATRGRSVDFPAVMPEVTAVGGTQFVEGSGNYWSTTNSANFGSALSYIPEAAWNESGATGLISSGGGASLFYPRPAWQNGPGVPNDGFRHVPDIALSAAGHDAYEVSYLGLNVGVSGTSASAPSLAGILALLNQYQVSKGFQKTPGLGNINPQLYRLAQSAPTVFHDIVAGDNIVNCAQNSPDCLAGSFGYPTTAGYDMATGLGSIDANNLVTLWNTKTNGVTVRVVLSNTRPTVNDTVSASALVAPASGGTPTGTVDFSLNGIPLGSASLSDRGSQGQAADISFPVSQYGTGNFTLTASYSGDAAFSGGGANANVTISAPSKVAGIVLTSGLYIWPSTPDSQGLLWQTTVTLRDVGGVASMITGFTIDGQAQPLAKYFPATAIPASGSLTATLALRNLTVPAVHVLGVSGVDATGQTWSRQISVNFFAIPPYVSFNVTAAPLTLVQNPSADPDCQWPVQVNIDETGGFRNTVTGLFAGDVSLTSQISAIFGTPRLDAWGSLQGTVCFNGITAPTTDILEVAVGGVVQTTTLSFGASPAPPAKMTASPAAVTAAAAIPTQTAQAAFSLNITDKTQPWTAAVFPSGRTTSWLTLSQYAGTGPAQLTVFAKGQGFGPGAYRAMVVIQSANTAPQTIVVPVMFVLGGSTSGTAITAIANPATYQPTAAPGALLTVFGTRLAADTVKAPASATILPYTLGGVTATVNGTAAPIAFVSPEQVNIQVPYEQGAGPAVVSINNNGEIAGFAFTISPSAPGIFLDADGNLPANPSAAQGTVATLYMTGAGEVANLTLSGRTIATTTLPANFPKPMLPISVTVGGTQAFLPVVGLAPGQFGVTRVDFIVPTTATVGSQPVIVTVGGVSSPPAHINVQPAQ